jgi:peptidoglycan/LPS O-acetylase OafA/YrhL
MQMVRKAKVVVAIWVAVVIWLAWLARIPNPYAVPNDTGEPLHSYYWEYSAGFLAIGVIAYLLVRPWRSGHNFVGSLAAFVLFASLLVFAAFGSMHSPPVHWYATYVLLGGSLVLLFYSGYALGRRA